MLANAKEEPPSFLTIILGDMGGQRAVTRSELSQTTTEIDQGSKIYHYNQYATLGGPWHIFIPYERRKLLPTSLKFQFRPPIPK